MARLPLFGNGWLKFAGLALVALPLFTPVIVPYGRDAGDALRVMLELGAYSAMVWAMIAAFSGLDTLAEYLSVGFLFGVTTAILTGLVAALTRLLPSLGVGTPTDLQILRTFLTTAVSVPLALFAVQCFPVEKILQRLHSGRRSSYDARVAVCSASSSTSPRSFRGWPSRGGRSVLSCGCPGIAWTGLRTRSRWPNFGTGCCARRCSGRRRS